MKNLNPTNINININNTNRLMTINDQQPTTVDLSALNEFNEYTQELKLNDIENLDSILNETRNKLSTSAEKDGYWCFKRKEGCKYLPVGYFYFEIFHFYS